jgi:hypothetical protein
MSIEDDTLAQVAQVFSQAIRAERTATMDALETERKATLTILQALRQENQRRARASTGRFVWGFLLGASLAALVVILFSRKSGRQRRENITARISSAIEQGRQAAALREHELWEQYQNQLSAKPKKDIRPL